MLTAPKQKTLRSLLPPSHRYTKFGQASHEASVQIGTFNQLVNDLLMLHLVCICNELDTAGPGRNKMPLIRDCMLAAGQSKTKSGFKPTTFSACKMVVCAPIHDSGI